MRGPGGGRTRSKRRQRGSAPGPPPPRPQPPWRRRWGGWLDRLPWIGPRRAAARVTRAQVLEAVPFRNNQIEWELQEPEGKAETGGPVVILRVPRRQDRLGKLLLRVFEAPVHKQVVLDELGTDVWQMCDGATSVDDLIRALARKHKLERREVEVSLTAYLRTLAQRGYIGLRLAAGSAGTGEGRK
ncbi:MAG: PqqD family protein [Armatimonadetes bacterium]|nr:PqqD family protein [Armatimonadota bacterium]